MKPNSLEVASSEGGLIFVAKFPKFRVKLGHTTETSRTTNWLISHRYLTRKLVVRHRAEFSQGSHIFRKRVLTGVLFFSARSFIQCLATSISNDSDNFATDSFCPQTIVTS